jgi:hypothetical protein
MTTRLAGSGRVTTDMLEAARIIICWHFCWHSRVEKFQVIAAHTVRLGGEGRNRTQTLYRSKPNTLCFKAYSSLILQGFKPFFRPPGQCSLIAQPLPIYCSLGETLGEDFFLNLLLSQE